MKKKYFTFIFGLLMLSASLFSQDGKFKALFMYNFTKYLEWPSNKQSGDFIIGVFGKSDITEELRIIAGKKKVGTQNITIKEISVTSELSACHILYVPENQSSKIDDIASICLKSGTVLITDKPGMAKTLSGINYVKVDGKQSFEVNKSNLEKQGVKVNSNLLTLGIMVQ